MVVFLVIQDYGYDGDYHSGIFSTKEKAQEYIDKQDHSKDERQGIEWVIEEFRIDVGGGENN